MIGTSPPACNSNLAVDAHATRLLLEKSPPEACVDSSLGPYVTSVLRRAPGNAATDDLIELLESHCQITSDVAREILSDVSLAVRTGDIPDKSGGVTRGRSRSKSLGAEPDAYEYNVQFLGTVLEDSSLDMGHSSPSIISPSSGSPNLLLDASRSSCLLVGERSRAKERSVTFDETLPSQQMSYEPLELGTSSSDWLSMSSIPPTDSAIIDLDAQEFEPALEGILGALDLEGEDENLTQQTRHSQDTYSNDAGGDIQGGELRAGNTAGDTLKKNSTSSKHSSRKHGKKSKQEANDLAAMLFRPSRPRSNSLQEQPKSFRGNSSQKSSLYGNSSGDRDTNNGGKHALFDGDVEMNSTVQLLLTLNSQLGQEAAHIASVLTDGDLNLAQYLIESARSASSGGPSGKFDPQNQQRRSRICRHELRGVCYRADCPYSHDLKGLTCLFWLKGRCRQMNCRFLHGFDESLLQGICKEYLAEQQVKKEEGELKRLHQMRFQNKKIRTANLLHHNQWSISPEDSNQVFVNPTLSLNFRIK